MKNLKKLFLFVLLTSAAVAITGCKKDDGTEKKVYTYNTYVAVSPSNWNQLTYQDNTDTAILNRVSSSFFEFNYEFDSNGDPVPGKYTVDYSAAAKLEDVSSQYVGEKWGIEEGDTMRAYKITLRNDLKWDDGTPIKAEDFVYSMKQQLDPLFQNYRADSYYASSLVLHNAENYVKQGQLTAVNNCKVTSDPSSCVLQVSDLVKGDDGVYKQADGKNVFFATKESLTYLGGDTLSKYAPYLDKTAYTAFVALADEDGNVPVTDDSIALLTTAINTEDWGNEGPECVPCYMYYEKQYDEMSFDNVGIFVGDNEYEIVICLDIALPLLKEDGSLSYKAAYNLNDLPLVKKDLYEKCKIAPQEGSTLWTTNYNSSLATSASWGPYKLTSFQAGKQFILSRNENWFGYGIEQYAGQYQTDRIVTETIKEWNTAWLKFQAGDLDEIGIDVTIAKDYKGSDRACFTPDDYVGSLQLQSSKEALKKRESEGVNKTILTYTKFRKALSLSIDRAKYTAQTTTSSLPGFGLYNTMHYYDVENGGVYRNTDAAKKVLCETYAVDYTKFESLDAAVKSITGYDLTTAKKLVDEAYDEALAAGDISATDKVRLTMGTGAVNEVVTRRFTFIQEAWLELVEGTKLEGRLEFDDIVDKGDTWSKDFRSGGYDVCMGGWTGAAWDPGYFLAAYLSPAYMYSAAWDTSAAMLEFTMPGVGEDGADVTDTLSLWDWYVCLNGLDGCKYNFGAGSIPEDKRVLLIAALEKEVLSVYYTVPLLNNFTAELVTYKFDYISYEYNTFMAYGGLRYLKYNYTDAEWAKFVKDNNGKIDYRS